MTQIWFDKNINLKEASKFFHVNMSKHLDIKYTNLGYDFIEGEMAVTKDVSQPYGVLHGGASCVLAETLGSIGSNLILDQKTQFAVGVSITANHLRSASIGENLRAKAQIIHLGRRTHVWDIEIRNNNDKLVCKSQLTTMVNNKP